NEIAIEPTGRFLYVLNGNVRTIDVFRIELSSGQLVQVQTIGFPPSVGGIAGIVADPTGRFIFLPCVCNSLNTRVRVFRIDPTSGLLTDAGGGGGSGNLASNGSAVDITGRFLYVINPQTNTVEAFSINQSTGLPTAIGTSSLTAFPEKIIADPSGRFVYVTMFASSSNAPIQAFRISTTNGTLIDAGSIELGDSATKGPAIDRTGR